MGGTVVQGDRAGQAHILQDYKILRSSQSAPNLPSFDLLQAKNDVTRFLARCFVLANQEQSKLFALRKSLKSKGLPRLDFVQQEGDFCGEALHFTSYFEYYPETLLDESKRNKANGVSFSCDDISKLAHQALKVLAEMHEAGYAHGNIRPQNFQFSPDSELKLLDSPLVTGLNAFKYSRREKKANYLSPQEFSDFISRRQQTTANKFKSDVFALGLVLLEMFTERSHQEYYLSDRVDFSAIEQDLTRLSGSCSFQLVDKLRLMLKEQEMERRDAKRLLRMFSEMMSRKSSLPDFGAP